MLIDSIKFRGHPCFRKHWSGFERFLPLNVIIGRNNVGKSHLLDLVSRLCSGEIKDAKWELSCSAVFDAVSLKKHFRPGTYGGTLQSDFWDHHGRLFENQPVTWQREADGTIGELTLHGDHQFNIGLHIAAAIAGALWLLNRFS